ncbi:hypothetical protein [Yinghuangia seranimata]|uniref:hypothetical protein n=1 Tax=Yinghuangia seranimata TaxID=408067 RepID=UPI00248BB3EE|nr:hypothetical protein [Yinghuangia seranimata]MDI2127566.1 hypothetical protein [Yinghuangia seranimata]
MSMHEIEDLVADSILLLDAGHQADEPRVREWIAALYAFQDVYDCSFTRFRVMDALVRRRFAYRFEVDAHPDHAVRRAYFDGLTGFTALREYDEDAEDDDDFEGYTDWLEDGYVDPPHLYCEAGTALWRRMLDAGRLGGTDAVAPRPVPLIEAVAATAEAAERAGDVALIGEWYALGCHTLLDGPIGCPYSTDELAEMPAVAALRSVVLRTGALPAGPPDGFDDLGDDELEAWWWAVGEDR